MLPKCQCQVELNSDVNKVILDYGVWLISALFTIEGIRVHLRAIRKYDMDQYERMVLNIEGMESDADLLAFIIKNNPEPFYPAAHWIVNQHTKTP
jgi:hypothetical protein